MEFDETMGIEDPGVGLVAFMETVSTCIKVASNNEMCVCSH